LYAAYAYPFKNDTVEGMENLQSELANIFKGELDVTDETREFYSHDASLF
jgi:hypothetical protein